MASRTNRSKRSKRSFRSAQSDFYYFVKDSSSKARFAKAKKEQMKQTSQEVKE